MNNTFIIILFSLILFSCTKKQELDGVWMGAYAIDISENDTTYSPISIAISFSNNDFKLKTFDHYMLNDMDTVYDGKYVKQNDLLIIENDTLWVKQFNEDSIIISSDPNQNELIIFKKIHVKSSQFGVSLSNKSYFLEGPFFADSIHFINDSISIENSRITESSFGNNSTPWKTIQFEDILFLIFQKNNSPPFVIINDLDSIIHMNLYYKQIQKFKLIKLNTKFTKSDFLGSWVWPVDSNIKLPPPPPPPITIIDSVFGHRFFLDIAEDSLTISQYGYNSTSEYALSGDGTFICFPRNYGNITERIWRISLVNDSSLSIIGVPDMNTIHSKNEKYNFIKKN